MKDEDRIRKSDMRKSDIRMKALGKGLKLKAYEPAKFEQQGTQTRADKLMDQMERMHSIEQYLVELSNEIINLKRSDDSAYWEQNHRADVSKNRLDKLESQHHQLAQSFEELSKETRYKLPQQLVKIESKLNKMIRAVSNETESNLRELDEKLMESSRQQTVHRWNNDTHYNAADRKLREKLKKLNKKVKALHHLLSLEPVRDQQVHLSQRATTYPPSSYTRKAVDTSQADWNQYDPCKKEQSHWDYSSEYIAKGHFHLKGLDFICIGSYVPEQYYVYLNKARLGYLRLRSGQWSVDYLPAGKWKRRVRLLQKNLNPFDERDTELHSFIHHFPDDIMRGLYMRHAARLLLSYHTDFRCTQAEQSQRAEQSVRS